MRRARRHPLIVLLCAVFLLGAQQAAYAHFLSHLGVAVETAAKDGGDQEHGAATTLSHVCTTCAAFSALDGAPPVAAVPPHLGDTAARPLPGFSPTRLVARPAPPCGARAPPAVL